MKMQPLTIPNEDGSSTTLLCKHREEWPPAHARLSDSLESLRARGLINEIKYQQLQTWRSVCGLKSMTKDKCLTCPMAMVERDGHVVLLNDSESTFHRPYATRSKRGAR